MFDELDVGKVARLWQAIHAGANFYQDASIVDERLEGIFCHDVFGDGPFWDPEIFVLTWVGERGD